MVASFKIDSDAIAIEIPQSLLLQILTLVGSLAMFLYGISLMSGCLEKMGDFIINISQSVYGAKTV